VGSHCPCTSLSGSESFGFTALVSKAPPQEAQGARTGSIRHDIGISRAQGNYTYIPKSMHLSMFVFIFLPIKPESIPYLNFIRRETMLLTKVFRPARDAEPIRSRSDIRCR
jgi:hypothetical protein